MGATLSALFSASSFYLSVLFSLLAFSFFVGCVRLFVFVLLSAMRLSVSSSCDLSRALASCCCSCRGGGFFFCVGGYACCGVCVFSSASHCFKRKPERCSLVHAVLAASSLCPVLLLLVHMLGFVVLVCVFDARARVATASFRLKFIVLLRRSSGDSSP